MRKGTRESNRQLVGQVIEFESTVTVCCLANSAEVSHGGRNAQQLSRDECGRCDRPEHPPRSPTPAAAIDRLAVESGCGVSA